MAYAEIVKFMVAMVIMMNPLGSLSIYLQLTHRSSITYQKETALKCGLCGIFVCGKCHAIKLEDENGSKIEHVCNKDDVESVTLKKKETKSCPGCGTAIYKIAGCSSMFCTHCNTPFNL